jgi:predicted glycosyltransferase
LRDFGLLHLLHPDSLTPEALGEWLARDLGPAPQVHSRVNMDGLARIPRLLEEVLTLSTFPVHNLSQQRRAQYAVV